MGTLWKNYPGTLVLSRQGGTDMNFSIGGLSTMALSQLQLTDTLRDEQTFLTMAAQKIKHQWETWKIFQDAQTEIYKIQQEVTLQRAKSQDKMFNKWDDYIKG